MPHHAVRMLKYSSYNQLCKCVNNSQTETTAKTEED